MNPDPNKMSDDELIEASKAADEALGGWIAHLSKRYAAFNGILMRSLELDDEKIARGLDA